jgi:hypothetical protein
MEDCSKDEMLKKYYEKCNSLTKKNNQVLKLLNDLLTNDNLSEEVKEKLQNIIKLLN